MGINAVSPAMGPAMSAAGRDRIKNLEQELNRLETEKRKATEAGDSEKVRELEKKIQRIKEQIDRLKQRGTEASQPDPPKEQPLSESYIDVYA